MAVDGSDPDQQRSERRFFGGMAALIILIAVVGFARTYFLRSLLPVSTPVPLALTPLIHLHAVLLIGWVLLFYVQARLIDARRVDLHHRFGVAGGVIAGLIVGIGALVAIQSVVRGVGPFGMDPRRFLIIPLFAVGIFAVFVVAGIRARRDPQSHKRLMLLATIALLPPAIARWVLLLGLGPPVILAVASLLVVPLVVWDATSRGSLHPVTLWGGLLVVVSGPVRLLLGQTDGWLAVSSWLVGLVA
jgi:hypothetical protein